MTQRTPHIRWIYMPFFFIFLSALMIFFTVSCGSDDTQLSLSTDQKVFSDTSNSASFGIVWPQKSIADSDSPALACNELGIVTVFVDVYDAADVHLAKASFACSEGEGIIENIPPGSNRKFVISGKGPQGNIICQGAKDGVTIVTNGHTNVGYIELLPITLAVISTIPADNAINVGLRTAISVTFSKAIAAESLTPDTFLVNDGTSNISGEISCAGRAVSFTPNRELDYNRRYTVTLTAAVKDREGNALPAPFSWTFVSLENIPPTVTEFYPFDAARGVGIFPTITAAFSEPMDAETINPATFLVQAQNNSDTIDIAGHVTYDDSTQQAIFLPAANLPCDSRLTVTLSGGMTDAVGNQMVERKWQFTTTESCGEQIAAGGRHILAVKADGTLWAWGQNDTGQLGDGTFEDKDVPTHIGRDTNWLVVVANVDHSLALKTDGTLWAWGENSHGELGDGTYENKNIPIQIGNDNNWAAISTGHSHSLALKTDGSLWTWGSTEIYLGDGAFDTVNIPTQIGSDTNWEQASAGSNYTVALKTNGTLWAWGHNYSGELGDGTFADKDVPTQIGGDTNWSFVVGNASHTLALKTDGTLWAWGANDYGQLGDGTFESKNVPIRIGSDTDWKSVASGRGVTIALKTDGTLWAWGYNVYGQLGDSTFENKNTPVQIGNDTNWAVVVASYNLYSNDSCYIVALKTNGTLWVWGYGYGGAPQVVSDTSWAELVTGGRHTLALKADGTLWAWGVNDHGQLGDGTFENKVIPTQIGSDTDWTTVVTAGVDHSIALKNDGTLWAWGGNEFGQVGDGTFEIRNVPTQIGNGTNWSVKAASSGNHTLIVKTDGTLWGWGNNDYGQLGDGTLEIKNIPTQIGNDTDWSAIAGFYHTLALKTNGTLWSWGNNDCGQLGDRTFENRTIPIKVGIDTNWSSIAAGDEHSLALKNDKTLWGWGDNSNGQLGDETFEDKNVPSQIGNEIYWSAVAAGDRHSLALRTNGTLWAWGYDFFGQIGDGTIGYRAGGNNIRTKVGNDENWSSVAAGGYYTAALKNNGTLWEWGSFNIDIFTPKVATPTNFDIFYLH